MAIFLILKLEHINARVQSFSFPSPFQNTIIIRIVVRFNSLLRMLGGREMVDETGHVPSPAYCLQTMTRVGVVLINPHQSTSRTTTTIHLLFNDLSLHQEAQD